MTSKPTTGISHCVSWRLVKSLVVWRRALLILTALGMLNTRDGWLSAPCPRRPRRYHPQLSHEVFCFVKEHGHFMALRLSLKCFSAVPILRMVCTSLDGLWIFCAVISARCTAPFSNCWVPAPIAPRLTLSCAAPRFT